MLINFSGSAAIYLYTIQKDKNNREKKSTILFVEILHISL